MLKYWQEALKFLRSDATFRQIVFYSEGAHTWVHLKPLARTLIEVHGRKIGYLTSSADDPGIEFCGQSNLTFCIGDGVARTALFKALDASVLVTTTPDLGGPLFQRSSRGTHYAYIHHSMVSTHMIYKRTAFEQFDTIFCVGPHHIAETRAMEELYGLPQKSTVAHGYGRLDRLLAMRHSDMTTRPTTNGLITEGTPHVLLAPTWGYRGLIETVGPRLVRVLLEAGFRVTLRPHPETLKRTPQAVKDTADAGGNNKTRFVLERDVSTLNSLLESDVMISDWSGIALEFAFGLERPVLFVDVPKKVLNDDYQRIPLSPLEISIRETIGAVVESDQIEKIPIILREMIDTRHRWRDTIAAARDEYVFNLGQSAKIGAEHLMRIADRKPLSPGSDAE